MNEAKKIRYARATYGSLAYDFNRNAQPEIGYEEEKSEKRLNPERKVRVEAQPKKRASAKSAAKVKVAPFAIIGFAAAAFMLIMVVMGYIQLTKIASESSDLQEQITDLKSSEAQLKIKYESTFDLKKVEDYAVSRLGMVPSSASQVYYLNGSAKDKAEVLKGSESSGFLKSVTTFLSSVEEYFK